MTVGPDILVGDTTHDLVLQNGDLVVATDIAQHAKIRLGFFEGEWFLDLEAGLPYFQSLFVKNPNLGEIEGLFRAAILETPGITAINFFELSFDTETRRLVIRWSAQSLQGTIGNLDEVQL